MRVSKTLTVAFASMLMAVGCGSNNSVKESETATTITTTPITAPNTVVLTTPATTEPPIDLSGVDFVSLARQMHGRCGEWHDLAISVGWAEEEWDTLSRVMFRESRCQPDAWNGHDAGLTQINQIHTQWLAEMGWEHPKDMFDPEYNLRFALRLWQTSGWKPWRTAEERMSAQK